MTDHAKTIRDALQLEHVRHAIGFTSAVALSALDALLAGHAAEVDAINRAHDEACEMLGREHAAEVEQLRQQITAADACAGGAVKREHLARADAETLRQALVHIEAMGRTGITQGYPPRNGSHAYAAECGAVARAALAAAQEPPAEACRHPLAAPHGEKWVCTTCGREVRYGSGEYVAVEPPAATIRSDEECEWCDGEGIGGLSCPNCGEPPAKGDDR